MICCTPKEAISYVSKSIIEKSELLDISLNHFTPGDSIIADRGIMVHYLFANQDVYFNTPTI